MYFDFHNMYEEMAEEITNRTEDPNKKIQELEKKVEELRDKLKDAEEIISTVNSHLEKKVVERTVEYNRLLKEKNKFIDNLSHDLATPLTPLISLLPMLREDLKNPKEVELLDVCIRNSEYIKRVITNAKELAEIGSTDMILKKESLYQIVDELIKKYEVVFNSCKIKVENKIIQDVFIKTEKNRLTQLFDHLTSNAVNIMKEGGTLTYESKPVTRDGGSFIQITVTDSGEGLTREQTDRLFDAFYKTDDSRHKLDSTGLGLTICKNIIQKHGGKIWADSHGPGTGTSIHFTVPSTDSIFSRSF